MNYWLAQTETGWAVGIGNEELAWFKHRALAELFRDMMNSRDEDENVLS